MQLTASAAPTATSTLPTAPGAPTGGLHVVRNPDGSTGMLATPAAPLPADDLPSFGFARLSFSRNFGLQRHVELTGTSTPFSGSLDDARMAAARLARELGQTVGLSQAADGWWLTQLSVAGLDLAYDLRDPADVGLVPLTASRIGADGNHVSNLVALSPHDGRGMHSLQEVFTEQGTTVHLDPATEGGIPPVPPAPAR